LFLCFLSVLSFSVFIVENYHNEEHHKGYVHLLE
jgi:hypothetical protein